MGKKIVMIGKYIGNGKQGRYIETGDTPCLLIKERGTLNGKWPTGTWFQARLQRVRENYYYHNLNSNVIKEGDK
jgi:hypothetical protein